MNIMVEHPANILRPAASRPPSANIAIEMLSVTKRYGDEVVVNGIDLSIAKGEFFSLLGPSGSGKTSSLMMVAGFSAPDSGKILVDGADIVPRTPQQRGFGMVFQNYAIFPHLNVFENVAFPLRARGMKSTEIKKRVAEALRMVNLEKFAQRSSKQLSGGQLQRVALARAVVFEPQIVLMDEPMGALDKNLRYQMQAEIKEIQQRLGMTVLYITHDQEEAMSMSDRLAIMNKGRIEQVASPLEVYERPSNAFVAQFLGQANFLWGDVTSLADGMAGITLPDGQIVLSGANDGLMSKGRASIFIRPERLLIVPDHEINTHNTNRITGIVRRVSYLGNVIRYHVVTVDGSELISEAANVSRLSGHAVGSRVTLGWDPRSSLAMPEPA